MSNFIARAVRQWLANDINDGMPTEILDGGAEFPRHARWVIRNNSTTEDVYVGTQNEDTLTKFFMLAPGESLEADMKERSPLYGYKQTGGSGAFVSAFVSALPDAAGFELTPKQEAD